MERRAAAVLAPERDVHDTGIVTAGRTQEIAAPALRQNLTTCAFVEWRLRELGGTGRTGTAVLRPLLEERGRGVAALESALEAAVWRLLVGTDLPHPVRQHTVTVGSRQVRLDFAWPDARVAVEVDGYAFHRGRRAFVDDRARTAALAAAGWRVIPVTWDEIRDRPEDVVAHVRATLRLVDT